METNSREFDDMCKLIEIKDTHGWPWILKMLSEHAATTGEDINAQLITHGTRQLACNNQAPQMETAQQIIESAVDTITYWHNHATSNDEFIEKAYQVANQVNRRTKAKEAPARRKLEKLLNFVNDNNEFAFQQKLKTSTKNPDYYNGIQDITEQIRIQLAEIINE